MSVRKNRHDTRFDPSGHETKTFTALFFCRGLFSRRFFQGSLPQLSEWECASRVAITHCFPAKSRLANPLIPGYFASHLFFLRSRFAASTPSCFILLCIFFLCRVRFPFRRRRRKHFPLAGSAIYRRREGPEGCGFCGHSPR